MAAMMATWVRSEVRAPGSGDQIDHADSLEHAGNPSLSYPFERKERERRQQQSEQHDDGAAPENLPAKLALAGATSRRRVSDKWVVTP